MSMKKILIVEDEQTLLKMIRVIFEVAGFEVLTAINGEEALAQMDKKPVIVLLDILMPGEDGIETLRKIKAMEGSENIPVIMLTNFNDPEKINEAKSAGAVDYLVKSNYDVDEVVDRVKTALNYGKE